MPATGEQPLLAHDHASERSVDTEDRLDEEDALLTGQAKPSKQSHGSDFWTKASFLTWAVIATVVAIILGVLYGREKDSGGMGWTRSRTLPTGKRNLIFMVSDGMGPVSLSLTRSFRQTQSHLPYDSHLLLDEHLIGSSRTRSSSSFITDSAAGATAFSCAQKSYNGAISVVPDHSPCGTILEAAKRAGYLTGLVVTTRITDATPACFASHVQERSYEDNIAEQELGLTHPMGRVVDLMLGGGRCKFVANSSTTIESCRSDDQDVISLAQEKGLGWHYISSRSEFDELAASDDKHTSLPLLGLFADSDIPYEIDRSQSPDNTTYPSLAEMATFALRTLEAATQGTDKGFFIMIEGSRIDHAGHSNDPAAQVREVLAYDDAFQSVMSFLSSSDTPGIVVGTSDHETGGLATARQLHDSYPEYHWFPSVLVNVSHSASYISKNLHAYYNSAILPPTMDNLTSYILTNTLAQGLGITDPSEEEIIRLLASLTHAPTLPEETWGIKRLLADMVSRRAQVGWSTRGHSAADVNIYAGSSPVSPSSEIGPYFMEENLGGNRENTEIGAFMITYLGFDNADMLGLTEELKSWEDKRPGWMEGGVGQDESSTQADAEVAYDAYEGDFKHGH